MKLIKRLYKLTLIFLNIPIILSTYFDRGTGREYNISFAAKISLMFRTIGNNKKVPSATHYLEQLTMITKILNIPRSLEGCVVECGTFKGGSATNLSLACELCGRKLEIFDSFEGLPEPSSEDKIHEVVSSRELHLYEKGAWRGTLEEVKGNISKYGKIGVCNFNVGYFEDTLPKFKKNAVFIFLDVDLSDSLKTCLKHLWPLLRDDCRLFTHEAHHLKIASIFFDEAWWRGNVNAEAPGLIGAGCGLGLFPESEYYKSSIGYAVKNPRVMNMTEIPPEK